MALRRASESGQETAWLGSLCRSIATPWRQCFLESLLINEPLGKRIWTSEPVEGGVFIQSCLYAFRFWRLAWLSVRRFLVDSYLRSDAASRAMQISSSRSDEGCIFILRSSKFEGYCLARAFASLPTMPKTIYQILPFSIVAAI